MKKVVSNVEIFVDMKYSLASFRREKWEYIRFSVENHLVKMEVVDDIPLCFRVMWDTFSPLILDMKQDFREEYARFVAELHTLDANGEAELDVPQAILDRIKFVELPANVAKRLQNNRVPQ